MRMIRYMYTTHASEAPIHPSPHFQFRSLIYLNKKRKQCRYIQFQPIVYYIVIDTRLFVCVHGSKSHQLTYRWYFVYEFSPLVYCTQLRADISFQNMTRREHRCIVCRNRLSSAVIFCSFQFRCVFFSISLSSGPSFQSDGNDKHTLAYMHMLTSIVMHGNY